MGFVSLTRKLAVCLLALMALSGCRRPAAVLRSAPAEFMLDNAMQHWYGRYDVSTRTARANLPDLPAIDLAGTDFAANDPVDITAIFDAAYTQAGRPRHVIVTAAVPHRSDKPGRPGDDLFNCLACRPVIGMAIFTLRNNSWLLESENSAVDLAGTMGGAPQVQLVTLGSDVHGIRLESRFDALYGSSRSVSLLVPWHETVNRAFAVQTADSNGDACGPESPLRDPCYAWERSLAFVAVPGQQYDDLTISASGTQLPPESASPRAAKPAGLVRPHSKGQPAPPPQAIPFTSVERYRFRDGHYQPLTEKAASPR